HVSIMEDITKLNKQWETTTEALQFRIKNIERVIEKQKQYNDEVSGLKSWLAEVDIFLQAEEAALGDIETLEAQLEQSNALQDDVATLQTNVDNITAAGKQLTEEGDAELKNIVENQLEELTKRWDLVTELARAQNKSLKEALARSQKVHEGIDKLNVWLDELEPKIPCSVPTNTPEELINAVELFTQLREDISIHSDDLRAINNIGDEMLQLDSSATHEELARRFTQLNGRWTDVVTQVDSKYKVFITAAQQYEDFKKVCSEESDWLDQLQAKLERSSKDAADAEEISEALDELEIFLHSHDESRLERIRSLAESLVQEGCVVETVQETTRSLTSRFDTLNAQASEQQSGLEGCVQEAQAWEREYVSVLDYLAQSDLILTQAITNQIQVDQVQVQEELLTQQVVLKKMQTQVEVYHSQGKTEAALRLEDQIAHLQKKYEEIEMKLQICQKPSDFDTRLTEVNQQLQEIGQRVHLVNMDSGDPEGIQEQLNQCLDLYQTLSEVKSEVESVIATGRKIVKEGQSSDPDGLTLQLDQLKALYNKLGGTVTEHRGILEKALRHSRKIHKDCNHLEEWLSTTECELDQREATVPATNVQGEVHFAQDEQAAKEAEMERFIIGLGEIKGWLESTEHHLLALKKLEPSEQDKIIKSVSSEIQNYKGQIENIRDTAVDLINHGVLFQARIQPELVLINQRWENIYRTVQVKSVDFEDTLSNVSQNEDDDDISSFGIGPELSDTEMSNHESFDDVCKLETEDVSLREIGEEGNLGSDSANFDIGIKKRKRFAKFYGETDGEIIYGISKKTEQPLLQKSLPVDIYPNLESRPRKTKGTSVITAESLGKALCRKGLTPRVGDEEISESSSSCRSGSNRGSSSEGSIDFGSETRGAISGDWDDVPMPADLSEPCHVAGDKPVHSEDLSKAQEQDVLRFSLVSASSIETDKDEVFTSEVDLGMYDDARAEVTEIDSSSSDESDDLQEPSKIRISAATIYEHAVIQALEGCVERVTGKESTHEESFLEYSEADVPEFKVGHHEVNKQQQNIEKTETERQVIDFELISVGSTQPSGVIVSERENKVEAALPETVCHQFTTQEHKEEVPEIMFVSQCKEESNILLKAINEGKISCESPVEEISETVVEVVVSKQFPEEENVESMTKMICTNLTREDYIGPLSSAVCSCQTYEADISKEKRYEEILSEIGGPKEENYFTGVDKELKKSTFTELEVDHSFIEPQYSTSVREEMELFETTIQSPSSPSISINLVSVEVGEETSEIARMTEIITDKCEECSVETEGFVMCRDNELNYFQEFSVGLNNSQSLNKSTDESVLFTKNSEFENMEMSEQENLASEMNIEEDTTKNDELNLREITRKISVSSSSSSGSSFEMVDHELEADLEEQLSTYNVESDEKASVAENEIEMEEQLDKIDEPDRVEEQLISDIGNLSLEVKLERHVSIDSSVSTLSEAETVIHVPISNLSKKTSDTVSVRDDSQIGVKTLKTAEGQESLVRSVSEELITKTIIPEGKSHSKESSEGVLMIAAAKQDFSSMPREQNVITMKEKGNRNAHVTSICSKDSLADENLSKNICEATLFVLTKDDEVTQQDSVAVEDVNLNRKSNLSNQEAALTQENNKQTTSVTSQLAFEKDEEGAYLENFIKHTSVTENIGIPDTVQEEYLKGEEGWTEVKIIKSNMQDALRIERRVSIDVAQVVEATEVIEEQEVTISIPDVHHGDSRDESSAASDEEIEEVLTEPYKKTYVHVLPDTWEKERANKSKEKTSFLFSSVENEKNVPVKKEDSNMSEISNTNCTAIIQSASTVCDSRGNAEVESTTIVSEITETSNKPEVKEVIFQSQTDVNIHVDKGDELSRDRRDHSQLGKEVSLLNQYEFKDIGFIVIEGHSSSKISKHKEELEKESSVSSAASNSNSSSPYYDASGEMVDSMGSDDVSTSMEVLHSSAEILDMSSDYWSLNNNQTEPAEGKINSEIRDKPVSLRDTRQCLAPGTEHHSRFSTLSCLTDASGEVIFSETEGEEYPYEDTTDDDLTLEEEAIKTMVEKKQSTRGPASETVYASRSYIKESAREQINVTSSNVSTVLADIHGTGQSVQQHLGDDEVDAFLREVTAMADKISEIKTKLQMVPSYQEAKEKAEALEQEVALLEPDVATVISHGDTLTLTTHMVDVPRANTIRIAVNDLRTHWSALKSETENVKLESEQVAEEISTISEKADEIISWSNDVSKRLHLVNNDESQLEALENEMTNKKAELDKLNESGILLKKYKYNQIQPVLTLLNMRWTEISMKFRQYRKGSLEKKTIVSTTKVESQETEPIIVPDFVASVNRLREAISVISRQLNATKLLSNQYDNLKTQEDELKGIKHGLETLKPRVDNLETERNAIVKNVSPTESEQVRRVMDKLREEWAQVNRGYTDKHSRWLQCSETWRTLQKTIDDFSVWLNTIEEKVQCTSNQPLPEAKITQKELEKQVTLKHRPSQTLQSMCKEVTEGMSADDGKRLQENVDSLMKRWRALLLDLAARRERIAGEEGGKESANSEYEALITWVDQAQALMDAPVNVTDEASLSAHTTMVQNHLVEMMTKQNLLKKLKDMKPKSITSAQMTTLETNLNKVVKTLPDYKNMVDTKLGIIKTLVADVEHLYKWTEEMRVKVALRNLTEEEIKLSKMTLREKEALYENLDSTYWVLAQDAEGKGLTVAVPLKNRMNTIESRLKALQGQVSEAGAAAITPTLTSPTFQTPPPPYVAGSRQKVDQEMAVKSAKEGKLAASRTETSVHATGTTVTSSVTSVIQDVIKFEESVLSAEGGLRAPSPLVSPPRHAPDSSPVLILASLDKSILQIRDWLTLMEQMTRQQTVVVGDADDIRQLTEKQKSVLRELEGKKPQLDELVASADSLKDDASRTQLHQKASEGDAAVYRFPTHSRLFDHLRTCFKVSKLREHWDETNSVVLARKTQLDAMYTDTHKFDAKRAELESWLARMEARLERMAPVARTADVLDQQIREQKGFHAEIHQYKHQVELFNQMTQRLIAIYQHDDTRRLKKITETINLRYSSLNSSIIARGKELHSAMNSLHNFDKALDKFASWMSEAESNTDLVELEVDKLGPARRDPQARGPSMHLK
ncbi:hypothetical protein OTU49_016299, partial [Cherax quadricarinatus]